MISSAPPKVSLDLSQQQLTYGNANVLYLLTAQITYQQAVLARVQAQANRAVRHRCAVPRIGWRMVEPDRSPPDTGKNAVTTLINYPDPPKP